MFDIKIKKYADLLVKTGVNIKAGQLLVIRSPIECADFAREVMSAAFKAGAGNVEILWQDEKAAKIKYMEAPDEIFDEFPSWQKELLLSAADKNAAYLAISASDPELMKEVDPSKMVRYQKASGAALKEYREKQMNNELVWCVASVPTLPWAKKVFPNMTPTEAVDALWEAIFKAVRADQEDPIKVWETHKENLAARMKKLNDFNFKALKFNNALGTDLIIELPKGHIWLGGADLTKDGHEFVANIPTEEIFTAPKRDGVYGTVVSALPLNLNGNLIENFSITFDAGKIVDFKAERGYENLKTLIGTDEGSAYLGEVALVPYKSPISDMNILFFNTLFDENAACHLAIGKAYPVCIKGGDEMDSKTLIENGVNDSLVHEDFMIGTQDLTIIGIDENDREIPVFIEGNFAF